MVFASQLRCKVTKALHFVTPGNSNSLALLIAMFFVRFAKCLNTDELAKIKLLRNKCRELDRKIMPFKMIKCNL